MNPKSPAAAPDASRYAIPLLVSFAALHAAMFAYDRLHPDRFLNADRAQERIGVVQGFIDAWSNGGMVSFLASHGIPGDWLPQALAYMAGGPSLVIAIQAALALLSILAVQRLGHAVGLGSRAAAAGAALYGLLPHTLVFPHQLAAEAIFDPLVVLSFCAVLGARSGLALGVATLVRPITLLWPVIHARVSPGPLRAKVAYLACALAPLLLWMCFILLATGEFSMGRSSHDLGHNLYARIHRMADALPQAQRPAPRPPGHTSAGIGEYLQFVARHPVAAAGHSVRDLVALTAKSGIERLTLDYLDLFPEARNSIQDSDAGWRVQLEKNGLKAAALQLYAEQPGLVLTSALAAVFFLAFMALALAGAWCWARDAYGARTADDAGKALRLLMIGFVAYIFITAQVVDAAQSRHRAPAEFALCVLAVAGWLRMRRPGLRGVLSGPSAVAA
jgi:hypothetical protein